MLLGPVLCGRCGRGLKGGEEEHEDTRKWRTSTDEAVSCNVFASNDTFEQKRVFGVVRDFEVGHTWCQEVCGELDVDRDAVSSLFMDNELFDLGEWWEGGELLQEELGRVSWAV